MAIRVGRAANLRAELEAIASVELADELEVWDAGLSVEQARKLCSRGSRPRGRRSRLSTGSIRRGGRLWEEVRDGVEQGAAGGA